MGKVHTEERSGVAVQYVNVTDGEISGRVYLLPGVPMDAGKIPSDPAENIDGLVGIVESKIPEDAPADTSKRVESICNSYQGRLMDAASIMMYSLEQGRFDEFAVRLEEGIKEFDHIHPDLRYARTDMTAFMMRMLMDLGIAPPEKAQKAIDFDEKYGAGVFVIPE